MVNSEEEGKKGHHAKEGHDGEYEEKKGHKKKHYDESGWDFDNFYIFSSVFIYVLVSFL